MKNMINFFKKNAFYVMAFVLAAGILAVAGITGFVSGQSEQKKAENAAEFEDRTAAADAGDIADAPAETGLPMADEMTGYNADVVQKILSMIEDGTLALEDFEDEDSIIDEEAMAEVTEDENESETDTAADDEDEAEMAGTLISTGYKAEDSMTWPVEGEIVLGYSMDTTTYFPTLEEYKCNPAILIQSEAGTDVTASYKGTVLDIYEDAQLGTVVETSLGNGYEAFYGQLENVNVSVGDTVEEGQVIGAVASPTRYFSVEGSHLNFKLTKDGEPVDPLDYLD